MFLFGMIVGVGLVLGILWLLRRDGGVAAPPEFVALRAKQRIQDIQRATIERMLDEARAQRRRG